MQLLATLLISLFIAYVFSKYGDKPAKDPKGLNRWEEELLMQLLDSNFATIKMHCYRPLLTGKTPDPDNYRFRQMVSELIEDAYQAPEGLSQMITPKAFRMLRREAYRMHRLKLSHS